ncbi:MAG: nicotinate-nucleotide--dimethylbenzimidazole phosphoribosyltransferase [Pirellula sp.]|jgi:nicotinate-nucleotide--dimethylbenzimidazole phosphoribosyltransferase|nr:nicotinate-nucleotide--dimethylbenzimidazole phosphoribosyltransferase [Pirellula sp.]
MSIRPDQIQTHLDALAIPPGSLGSWGRLAAHLCSIEQSVAPEVRPAELLVFAADHGFAIEGVASATRGMSTLMMEQMAIGGAVSAIVAEAYGIGRRVVDVGVARPARFQHPMLAVRSIKLGTDNIVHVPAMSLSELREGWKVGVDEARMSQLRGAKVLLLGTVGVGGQLIASCLARILADVPIDSVWEGPVEDLWEDRDQARVLIEKATDRVLQRCGYEIDEAGIAEVCGFEVIAMAGAMAQAAKQRQVVILDGVVATAAALISERMFPGSVHAMIAAGRSGGTAHDLMLQKLGLTPYLDWQIRLDDGAGAVALYPLVLGAAAWCRKAIATSDLIFPEG